MSEPDICDMCLESYKALESSNAALKALLAKERDEFGEKETRLKAENAGWLEKIEHCQNSHWREIETLKSRAAKYRECLERIANRKYSGGLGFAIVTGSYEKWAQEALKEAK